ncbi:MAG: hypothetical protein R6V27_10485 [Balneolaceae bacterium]
MDVFYYKVVEYYRDWNWKCPHDDVRRKRVRERKREWVNVRNGLYDETENIRPLMRIPPPAETNKEDEKMLTFLFSGIQPI